MRIVIKIGSALISRNNRLDRQWLATKISEIAMLYREKHQIVLVSSGAVAAGMEILSLRKRPENTLRLQMLSGQGQIRLIQCYFELFKEKYIQIAQVLLTHHNLFKQEEVDVLTEIIDSYLQNGIIPVVNENDIINKEEIETERAFTDNDILSALLAKAISADRALLLTNVDGLYETLPPENSPKKSAPIAAIDKIDHKVYGLVNESKSSLGLGGMGSKIKAAKIMKEAGIETIVGNGNYSVIDLLEEKVPCTKFSV